MLEVGKTYKVLLGFYDSSGNNWHDQNVKKDDTIVVVRRGISTFYGCEIEIVSSLEGKKILLIDSEWESFLFGKQSTYNKFQKIEIFLQEIT